MKNNKTITIDFEQSLTELNSLVEKMEQGGLSLEDSLQFFEQGINLVRQCQQALAAAEQKVKILTQQQQLEPYQENAEE